MYYKVLEQGKAIHGGDLKWSLPKPDGNGGYMPGRWHHVKGDIMVCRNGLHLTTQPYNWYTWNCEVYAAEGKGQTDREDNKKTAFRHARLLYPVEHPQWWLDAHAFVDGLSAMRWFQPDGQPDPSWKLFTAPTRDAARDAALYVCHLIIADLNIPQNSVDHIKARWNVWQKGYALLCDVKDVLYVSAKG